MRTPKRARASTHHSIKDHQKLLMNVAYRLLGSVADAEDAVQEAFARWYALGASERAAVEVPEAWLVTVTTRICLDVLKSARVRREHYLGEWLPEPIPTAREPWASHGSDTIRDPADRITLDESLSMALLVVLETMTPAERVAFVLHDVFGYTFAEIAEIVGRTPQACRQLAHSARVRARDPRGRPVSAHEHARVVKSFQAALNAAALDDLIGLLDPRATAVGDGGGEVRAATEPIVGADNVARHLLDIIDREPGLRFEIATVNGRDGLVVVDAAGATAAVLALAVTAHRVERIWAVRNPRKLTHWEVAPA